MSPDPFAFDAGWFPCAENFCLSLLPFLVPTLSLLTSSARFLEGVVYTLSLHFLSTYSFLNPLQSGFQATATVCPRSSGTSFSPNPTAFSTAHFHVLQLPCGPLLPS